MYKVYHHAIYIIHVQDALTQDAITAIGLDRFLYDWTHSWTDLSVAISNDSLKWNPHLLEP